jgi:hypothetical protein
VIACQRLLILGLIVEREPRKRSAQFHRPFLKPRKVSPQLQQLRQQLATK